MGSHSVTNASLNEASNSLLGYTRACRVSRGEHSPSRNDVLSRTTEARSIRLIESPLVGVDLGGTEIKIATGHKNGEIADQVSIPTNAEHGPDSILEHIAATIRSLLNASGASKPLAIGMGVPGLVDVSRGVTKFLPNFPTHWRDIAVAERLQRQFDCPVDVLNDARAATLGELSFGHGTSIPEPTMAFLSIGTGIGGGVVVDGKLRLGTMGSAGELGHQTIIPDGPMCACGNQGCLEAIASGPAIAAKGRSLMESGLAPRLRQLTDEAGTDVTTELMSKAADHDRSIADCIEQAGVFLGIGVSNTIVTIHPDLVVIGGGVARFGERLLSPIRRTVKQRVKMFPTDGVRILPSRLGHHAGVIGAIAIAKQTHLVAPPR